MDPKMNNQSQLISGKDSNWSQPKSGNGTLCGAQIIDHEIDIYFQSSHNSYSEEG